MNKIKLIIAFALVTVMTFAISVNAFAAELNQNQTSGAATAVYKAGQTVNDNGTPDDPTDDTVSGTDTITIPDYIVVADGADVPTNYDVTAKDVLIPYATALNVAVDFESNLKLSDNPATTVTYDLKNNDASVKSGDAILTVAAGNEIDTPLLTEQDYPDDDGLPF